MKRSAVKAGIVALALVSAAGIARAAQTSLSESMVPAPKLSTPQQETTIRHFLAKDQNLAKLRLTHLQKRLHEAEEFRGTPGLTPELAAALDREVARIAAEIARRGGPEPEIETPPLPPYDPQQAQPTAPTQQ